MTSPKTLIINLGLSSKPAGMPDQLAVIIQQPDCVYQTVEMENMSTADWDKLLSDILLADKSITL